MKNSISSNNNSIEQRKNNNRNHDIDNDFGITSMDDSHHNWVAPKVLLHQQPQHFRMIVCGDSGIGKSSLVYALSNIIPTTTNTTITTTNDNKSLEPIEIFIPNTDICIIDTTGYGALLRAENIFSNVKSYIENQFEKTNQLFSGDIVIEQEKLTYIVDQSSDILTHIDACLYLIMGRLKAVDIEYMKSIHELVEIIPVIIQPDLSLRPEIRIEQRLEILVTMETNQIKYSYLGYNNYQELINGIKKDNHCPPFMLDWSTTKSSFHGLFTLKQVLFQYQYKYLRYKSTEKFIEWWILKKRRKSINTLSSTLLSSSAASISASAATATASSQEEQQLKNIKISQYATKRRHSMEREMLIQEKKLKQEFDLLFKQKKTELILKELNLLFNQEKIVIKKKEEEPMIRIWILLSILLSIFICYQNRNFFFIV